MDIFSVVCLLASVVFLFIAVHMQKKAEKTYGVALETNKDSIKAFEDAAEEHRKAQGFYLELQAQAAIQDVQRGEQ